MTVPDNGQAAATAERALFDVLEQHTWETGPTGWVYPKTGRRGSRLGSPLSRTIRGQSMR